MDVAGFTKSFVIDQGTVLGVDQLFAALYHKPLTDPKREGICTGLSMIWLARLMMFHEETPKQRKDALHSAGGYRWGGKTQDIHLAAGGTNIEAMYTEALKAYALRPVSSSITFKQSNDPKQIGAAMAESTKQKHAYRLWNIGLTTSTGEAGHMVASYASGGKLGLNRHLYFFDPNMGEFRLGIGDTQKFITNWVAAYAASFSGVRYLCTFAVER